MIKMIKFILSFIFRLKQHLQYKSLRIGRCSRVAFWRIRPVRGNQLIIGEQSIVETKIVFERAGAVVYVGDRTYIGSGIISVAESLIIGNDVMFAWGVTVTDHNSHSVIFSERSSDVANWLVGKKNWSSVHCAPVRVCDKAWIGFNSVILKGVTVGEGAVIGAGSVVTKDVPPWTIVAGNPARVIREIPESER